MTEDRPLAPTVSLALACCVLAACSARTDVSLTGNTPARYSHVWITVQEVWFNTSATAGPDDSGWLKFKLSTPATVDLVAENGGNLGSVVTGLRVTPGTYSQLRLIPVDPSAALTSSAQSAGAQFNAEADFVDAGGTTQQLPLELLNPGKGVGIQTSLHVPVGNVGSALSATRGLTSNTTTTPFASTAVTGTGATATVTPTTTTPSATPAGTTSPSSTPPNEFAVTLDGGHDLVQFTYATTPAAAGVMLSSHPAAYDLTRVGAIQGTLTLTNLSSITSTSGAPAIQASAQVLSADGTRHVIVSSTPVHSDGTFMLYPLAAGSDSAHPIDYDVVIHGSGIATIIIKTVAVAMSSNSSTATTTNTTTTTTGTGTTTGTTTTTGMTTTAGTTGTTGSTSITGTTTNSSTTITPVSVGTLVPRAAASFAANLAPGASRLPAGAVVSFYQTLGAKGEVPYVIESAPIDPFNQVLAVAQELSKQTVDSGTWSSSGAAVTLVSAAPHEGAGAYVVSASAPSFADGALTTKVSSPVPFTLPALALASGAASGKISATISQATPGKYDQGDLLVSHDGALVAAVPIDSALAAGSGSLVSVTGVPAGTSAAVYYVTIRAWNSRKPSQTLKRQSYPSVIDLRGSGAGSLELTVN
jgi:Domain of unknown function (DUF4382)